MVREPSTMMLLDARSRPVRRGLLLIFLACAGCTATRPRTAIEEIIAIENEPIAHPTSLAEPPTVQEPQEPQAPQEPAPENRSWGWNGGRISSAELTQDQDPVPDPPPPGDPRC